MKTFTTSANRFFKIQERLKEEITTRAMEYRTSTSISIKNPIPSQLSMAKMQEIHAGAQAALDAYNLASKLYLSIRKAMAELSSITSGALAELDRLKANEAFLSAILRTVSEPSVISLDDLESYKKDLMASKENNSPFANNSVVISLMSAEEKQQIAEELEKIRLRSFGLQENIAEANQRKVSISVTDDELDLVHKLIGVGG